MAEEPLSRTEETLLAFWRDLFAQGAIGIHDDFFVLGGHSLLTARLSTRVVEVFGIEIPHAQLFETPTIAELAALIDQQRATDQDPRLAASGLVRLKPGRSGRPLFCMPDLLGGIGSYLLLARHLVPEQAVYGVQGQGVVGEPRPLTRVGDMAAHCVRELRKLQPHGPYHLAGSSFAGLVAFEAAQQLRAAGEDVALVALFDTWLPRDPRKPRLGMYIQTSLRRQHLRAGYFLRRQRREAGLHLRQLRPRRGHERLAYLRTHLRAAVQERWRPANDARPRPFVDLETRHNRILEASRLALSDYRPAPYAGRVVYFHATDRNGAPPFDQRRAWAALARGGLDLHHLPGNHHVMLGEPNVQTVAHILAAYLDPLPLSPAPSPG